MLIVTGCCRENAAIIILINKYTYYLFSIKVIRLRYSTVYQLMGDVSFAKPIEWLITDHWDFGSAYSK